VPRPRGLERLRQDLDDRQEKVDEAVQGRGDDIGEIAKKHWTRFKSNDNAKARQRKLTRAPSVWDGSILDPGSHKLLVSGRSIPL
jgi:hypothetical protein